MIEGIQSPALESPESMVGRKLLDRYRVEKLIGQGGMSVVFRGTDERLKRPVAIKVFGALFSVGTSKLTQRHFVQEAFALSALRHPNTIRIFDFGSLDVGRGEAPFQIAEYMDGGTLADLVRRKGPLDPESTRRTLEAIAGAVAEAHANDIVHRDIKPSNILFGRAGRQRIVKLADFSVAQACALAKEAVDPALEDITIADSLSFFSLAWSAPEQIRGTHVEKTADVYGLGLVLGYMLSGEKLRSLQSPSDLYLPPDVLDGWLERTVKEQTNIPPALKEVCLKACRAKPEERYPSVESFVGAIDQALREKKRALDPPSSPWMEASPVPPIPVTTKESNFTLVLQRLEPGVVLAGGRRVRISNAGAPIDLELCAGAGTTDKLRARVGFLPAHGERSRAERLRAQK